MPKASRFIRDKAEDGIGDNGEDGQPNDGIDTAAKVNKVIRETNGGGCPEKGKGHGSGYSLNPRPNKQAQQMDLNGAGCLLFPETYKR